MGKHIRRGPRQYMEAAIKVEQVIQGEAETIQEGGGRRKQQKGAAER